MASDRTAAASIIPSIVTGNELKSEGVGSYWPFATGKRVKQANLLLHQIVDSPNTRYVLIPNQHIGVYKVGFAAEWISREYLARHGGAKIRREHLEPARCPLLRLRDEGSDHRRPEDPL